MRGSIVFGRIETACTGCFTAGVLVLQIRTARDLRGRWRNFAARGLRRNGRRTQSHACNGATRAAAAAAPCSPVLTRTVTWRLSGRTASKGNRHLWWLTDRVRRRQCQTSTSSTSRGSTCRACPTARNLRSSIRSSHLCRPRGIPQPIAATRGGAKSTGHEGSTRTGSSSPERGALRAGQRDRWRRQGGDGGDLDSNGSRRRRSVRSRPGTASAVCAFHGVS